MRTVLVASAASAIAAVVTSFFWRSGTPIAAAVTPLIVAVLSELLHRPTAKLTNRVTRESPKLSRDDPPAVSGPAQERLDRLERLGERGSAEGPAEPTLYRADGARRRGRVHPRFVIVTALIAFVAAAAVITVTELVGGESIGTSGRQTTLFGGGGGSKGSHKSSENEAPKPEDQTTPTQTSPDSGGADTGSTSPKPAPRRKPAPAPKPQPSTQPTQTGTGTTGTTPKR